MRERMDIPRIVDMTMAMSQDKTAKEIARVIASDLGYNVNTVYGIVVKWAAGRGQKNGLSLSKPERQARVAEMRRLHTEEGKTLQEVGDIYGISRERVRQLIGSLGYGYPAAYDNKIIASHPELTNGELCSILGRSSVSRGDHRHAIAGGAAKAGAQIEDKVSAKLSELGIAHKSMPHAHPFDILLENGKRIDVKASFRKMHPPTSKNEYYSFGTKKDVRGDDYCDFFILVVVPTMDMFIVPNEAVRPGCQQIHMNWPATRKPSKFHQYLNRFDLLEGE